VPPAHRCKAAPTLVIPGRSEAQGKGTHLHCGADGSPSLAALAGDDKEREALTSVRGAAGGGCHPPSLVIPGRRWRKPSQGKGTHPPMPGNLAGRDGITPIAPPAEGSGSRSTTEKHRVPTLPARTARGIHRKSGTGWASKRPRPPSSEGIFGWRGRPCCTHDRGRCGLAIRAGEGSSRDRSHPSGHPLPFSPPSGRNGFDMRSIGFPSRMDVRRRTGTKRVSRTGDGSPSGRCAELDEALPP
jgi:hypothetical protein